MAAKPKITKCIQVYLFFYLLFGVICSLDWEGVGGGNFVFYVCPHLYYFCLNVCGSVIFKML